MQYGRVQFLQEAVMNAISVDFDVKIIDVLEMAITGDDCPARLANRPGDQDRP
ncbi:hypothetical protein [Halalkalicoccus salilacus]|uniref:hypothetical protein n=1 Tax=Halalkalicoccus salilacus TaxID=3117459 RepID=UPI00300F6E83